MPTLHDLPLTKIHLKGDVTFKANYLKISANLCKSASKRKLEISKETLIIGQKSMIQQFFVFAENSLQFANWISLIVSAFSLKH